MRRMLYLLTLAAFVFSVTMATAAEPLKQAQAGKPEAQPTKVVNCCIKGKCKELPTEADCTKEGGKVVKDCKECK